MRACVRACVRVCVRACVRACGYAGTRVRGYAGTRVRGYAGTRVRGYAGTRVRRYAGTVRGGRVGCACVRACVRACAPGAAPHARKAFKGISDNKRISEGHLKDITTVLGPRVQQGFKEGVLRIYRVINMSF